MPQGVEHVFTTPAFLLLALVLPPLLWWWLRRRRGAVRHPAVGLFAGLPAGRARLARLGGAALRGLALLLLVVALAGPRWPDLRTRIDAEGVAIVMAVDVSGSMAERDFDWDGEPISRLEAVQRVFRLFVAGGAEALPGGANATFEGRPTDLIGLVTFATRPESTCPLTLSHSALLRLLDLEQPRSQPDESQTNVTDAVAIGLGLLEKAGPRRKVLVVLSDGEHNVAAPPSHWKTRQAGQIAASLRIPIYAIDASGSKSADPTREAVETPSPGAAPPGVGGQTLQDLAHISLGRYFPARDTARLLEACRAIDRLERVPTSSYQYRRYHEGYPWFALASFVLFWTALAFDLTVWRRLP